MQRTATKRVKKVQKPRPVRKFGMLSLEKKSLRGDEILIFKYLKCWHVEDGTNLSSVVMDSNYRKGDLTAA